MISEQKYYNGEIKTKTWPKYLLDTIHYNKTLINEHNKDNIKYNNIPK